MTLRGEPTDSADLVVGDAFGGVAVPWHLTTEEFARDIRRVLRPDGLYLLNVIDYEPRSLVRAEEATLREVFANVALVGHPAPGGNHVFLASDAQLPELPKRAAPARSTCPRRRRRCATTTPPPTSSSPRRHEGRSRADRGERDPVIRNLRITECYSRLAAAMPAGQRELVHIRHLGVAPGGPHDPRRGPALPPPGRAAERRRAAAPDPSFWRWLLRRGLLREDTWFGGLHTPFDAFELASDAVARGNLKVFAEIGLVFARWLEDGVAPAEPPLLRQAFARYEQRPSRSVVLANLEIGLHEQTRLQPEIREALDAALAPKRRLVAWPLQRKLTQLSREVITESLMVLTLPGAVLWLGRNLEAPGEVADPELRELMARYEPVPPALDDCGAEDWSVLEQRMHYIVHLFRPYHEDGTLASPPFTAAQVERIRAGELPDGEL